MRLAPALACALAVTLGPLATTATAAAPPAPAPKRSEPPNQNDRCSKAGKDICGTTGVGYYKVYRYGIRWFGDYRHVTAGAPPMFCIDLRWWYPAARYRYADVPASGLRNRDGGRVSLVNLEKMSYALWRYGRTSNPDQAAAVMLYVHSLMGDARAGEVDPAAISRRVATIYTTVARAARRFHGPYRLHVVAGSLQIGQRSSVRISVTAASGAVVPNVPIVVDATGSRTTRTTTGRSGVALVAVTPLQAASFALDVHAGALASTLPRILGATTTAASKNAQRLAVGNTQDLADHQTFAIARRVLGATTTASPAVLLAGGEVVDSITISGALPSWNGPVAARIYGPFASSEAIVCDGTPLWSGSVAASGSGTVATTAATIATPGWYGFQEDIPGDASHTGLTTPCDDPAEQFRVEAQPDVTTVVSDARVLPGATISDQIMVTGLVGQSATVHASLYGPFATVAAINCETVPAWSGDVPVDGDGTYLTDSFTVVTPGYYTYQESIEAAGFVRSTTTTCGDTAETTLVAAQPAVVTTVSDTLTHPTAGISDRLVVSGVGVLGAVVQIELWGPFPDEASIVCTGTPYWTGSLTVAADGSYVSPTVILDRAGYYTYRESIVADETHEGVQTACGDTAETSLARAAPAIRTAATREVLRGGSLLADRVKVSGLGATAVTVVAELFGPFASRAAISCSGRPRWTAQLALTGDGTVTTPSVRVSRVGFYSYRERIAGGPLVDNAITACAVAAETGLVAPAITTGSGDPTIEVRASRAGPQTPTRVTLARVGINAPVSPVGIDTTNAVLGVPSDIRRTGWWRDGSLPGAARGAVLIAGHVDSAAAGRGSFFALNTARRGDLIDVQTSGGHVVHYRVTSVRLYLKKNLPLSVWSVKGAARLVLVTCGGRFDTAAGHYQDNVVVTAAPI